MLWVQDCCAILALSGSLCAVAAFWPLVFLPMFGMDTRASSKSKMGFKAVDESGSHQNGMHLLSPIPGGDYNELFDLEEEAMRMDCLTEMKQKQVHRAISRRTARTSRARTNT